MRSRSRVLVLLCVTLLTHAIALGAYGQNLAQLSTDGPGQKVPVDGRYIVLFHSYGPNAVAAVRAVGGRVALELPRHAALAAWLPAGAAGALARNPLVKRVEPDARRYPMSETTPYGITMVQAPLVSDSNASSRTVCIIDSGYYIGHEDLPSGSNVTGDSDPFGAGNWYQDGFGHGTHVAGTIAALANNGVGVVGILPSGSLKLHIVRVFGDDGTWTYSSSLVDALDKCRAAGANVVNMSLGGTSPNLFEEAAFDDAYSAGVLSVAAAGNAGDTSYLYPASYSSVVSVAAIDSNKVVASFSQQNDQVELAAPGVSVLSTLPFIDTDTLTVDGVTYEGNWMMNAARTSGVTGAVADGGRCTATNPAWSGQVVMCERGDISFYDKVMNVQKSGGAAAVIYNNTTGNFLGTLGSGNSSNIPAISLTQADGQYIVANKTGFFGTVVSTVQKPASGYEAWDGTSMATPHVSGVAALVWSNYPSCSNAEIRKALDMSALDLGTAGRDNAYGYGLVQAKAAFDYLASNTCTGSGGGGGTVGQAPVISNVYAVALNARKGTFRIGWTTDIPATSHVLFTCCGLFSDYTLVTDHRMDFKGRKGYTYEFFVFSEESPGGDASMAGPFYYKP